MQLHTQQPAWQGRSITAGPSAPPGVALLQPRSTGQKPSRGSGTKMQPLLVQEVAKKILGRKDMENGAAARLIGDPAGSGTFGQLAALPFCTT